jgi:uncharacterized protein YukE
MALPQQVQAALDAAEATLAATNAPSANEASPAEPALDAQPQPDPFGGAPQPQAAPVEPPAPAAPKPDPWEARYTSLRGLFEKTVPELQGQVKTLQSNLNDAITRLNQASEKQESQPARQQEADPKDAANFGQDLVEMVSRVAGQAIGGAAQRFDAKVAQFEQQMARLEAAVQGTTQQVAVTAEQAFFDRVTKLVPTWEQVNVDPAFVAWLQEIDPVYGLARQAALNRAQESLNADHAAAVFQAFTGPQQAAPRETDPLDKQMSPRSAASVQPRSAQPQTISQADVTTFYDDVRRGLYRGNDAEVARIEQVINAALAESRII